MCFCQDLSIRARCRKGRQSDIKFKVTDIGVGMTAEPGTLVYPFRAFQATGIAPSRFTFSSNLRRALCS